MPIKKESIKLRTGRLPRGIAEKLEKMIYELYGVDPSEFIPKNTRYTCFNELCIICSHSIEALNMLSAMKLFAGKWIALYRNKILAPSIPLVNEIYSRAGLKAAVLITDKGIKAFLYGKDVLPESIIKVIPPSKGLYAVIDQYDNEVIGFVRWNPIRQVYENIYDAGIFIRLLG